MMRMLIMAGFLLGLALAEPVKPAPVEKLAVEAEAIVHGRVRSTSVQRGADGEIFTEVAFESIAIWKGKVDDVRERVVHSGGILGEEAGLASGQVEYVPGEEFVGFWVRNRRGELVTIGMKQGKFRVNAERMAERLLEKRSLLELETAVKGALK